MTRRRWSRPRPWHRDRAPPWCCQRRRRTRTKYDQRDEKQECELRSGSGSGSGSREGIRKIQPKAPSPLKNSISPRKFKIRRMESHAYCFSALRCRELPTFELDDSRKKRRTVAVHSRSEQEERIYVDVLLNEIEGLNERYSAQFPLRLFTFR